MARKPKKAEEKKPFGYVFGRPTEYKEEFCQQLIEHMAEGYSFESFCGRIFVCRKTLYNWLDTQPDFLHAKNIGRDLCLFYWETTGNRGTNGKIPFFNPAAWIFNMKNRFKEEWKEKWESDTDKTPKPSKQIILNYNLSKKRNDQ